MLIVLFASIFHFSPCSQQFIESIIIILLDELILLLPRIHPQLLREQGEKWKMTSKSVCSQTKTSSHLSKEDYLCRYSTKILACKKLLQTVGIFSNMILQPLNRLVLQLDRLVWSCYLKTYLRYSTQELLIMVPMLLGKFELIVHV